MGGLLYAMGELPAARAYFDKALVIRKKVLGEKHPDTKAAIRNLDVIEQKLK
jgi:hypothetical protein